MAPPIKFMILSPAHFHAALLLKAPLATLNPHVYVYSDLDPELLDFLDHVRLFNSRNSHPTAWELDVRAGHNFVTRCFREQPGNTIVLSGRNRSKIDWMLAAVENNLNVLADKPWIIDAADFPKLLQLEREAERREVLIHDMMTERFEITNILVQQLVQAPDIFGEWKPSSPDSPSLSLTSTHHLYKLVGDRVVQRPPHWFDLGMTGDGLADVGTHLVDLAIRFLAPNRALDWQSDVRIHSATRASLSLTLSEFQQVTGHTQFPPSLHEWMRNDELQWFGNGQTVFTIGDVAVGVNVVWEWSSPHGDSHHIVAQGTRAIVRAAPYPEFGLRQQVTIQPQNPQDYPALVDATRVWCDANQHWLTGMSVIDMGDEILLHIPEPYRTTHEDLFAAVLHEYIRRFEWPQDVPRWESPNRLTKYHLTTQAVARSRLS